MKESTSSEEQVARALDQEPRGSLRALVLATLAFMLCFSVWGLIAPLTPLFRESYGLSNVQTGFLVAVPVILGSLLRIPAGIAAERWGARIVFPALLLLLVVPLVFAALSRSYGTLIGAGFLLGASGASFAIGIPFVASWFPAHKQGFALGIYGMGNIGTAFAAVLAPRVAAGPGWPYAFWIFAPLLVVFAAIFWLVARESPHFTPRRASLAERARVLVDRPVSWVLILFYFVTFGGFVAMGSFLPTFLTATHGLTPTDAGARTAGFIIVATLARPLGGWLADRWGGTLVLSLVFLLEAFFAIILAFESGMTAVTIGFLGSAGVLGIGNGAVFKLVADLFRAETGTLAGLVGAAGGLGGFFPPLVLGLVSDVTGSYAIAFMLLSEFALACLIINLLVLHRHAEWFMPEQQPE
ncbi:MFS transporter [Myxococcota bacterium]|nr:MFS transporter [Myxococcota bacterium]MCZ7619881.1 MFS transporter [Myxococcota bacterium]